MKKWWKNPVLQGDDNDYGNYDYMIEEIPRDSRVWYFAHNVGPYKCDYCGKERRAFVLYTHYFRTLDGGDSLDEHSCWVCEIKYAIRHRINSITKPVVRQSRVIVETMKMFTYMMRHDPKMKNKLKRCYKFAKAYSNCLNN